MKFSIVITTYNRFSLVRRAVESALNQTLPCEIVVADDGSSDGTEKYIKSLGNSVVYHRNSVNLGHSATVNVGVGIASGDWIKLMDDDDYLAPECIERIAKAIANSPNAVISSCQAIQVDNNGLEVGRTKPVGSGKIFYVKQEDIHYGMLLEKLPFGTPIQVAFKKDAFLNSGQWNTAFDGNCDDIYSWIKIAEYGDAVFINEYLSYRMLWSGACHKRLSLQERWQTNFLLKQKIHSLVSPKYKDSLPSINTIENYLRLYWAFVGLKQQEPWAAFSVAREALLSLEGWSLLWQTIYFKLSR